jgi:hypothetical protein
VIRVHCPGARLARKYRLLAYEFQRS